MKKSFMARFAPVMIAAIVAVFGFMMSGCEQQPDNIIQSVQNITPAASDFTIIGLTATADGSPKTVSVKAKTGKSQGAITVYYEGTGGSVYPRNTASPCAAGKYAVTFDVAAAEGFNAANGLKAGTLTISIKKSFGNESEDDGHTDDDDNEEPAGKPAEKPSEKPVEEFIKKPNNEENEEINKSFIDIDFEDGAWNGGYTKRIVKWNSYEWTVMGFIQTGFKDDRKEDTKSIRLRGNSSDTGDNTNRIELLDYLTRGIESISFDYASYGANSGGTIIIYIQRENEDWEEAGRVTDIPSWTDGGSQMMNAKFEINITDKVRFKIEKVSTSSGKSVNVDNIRITYCQ